MKESVPMLLGPVRSKQTGGESDWKTNRPLMLCGGHGHWFVRMRNTSWSL